MFDTINFRITKDEAGGVDFLEEIPCFLDNVGEHLFNGFPSISGSLNGLKVIATRHQLKVKDGSLCKFALGDNYKTLGRRDTKQAIEKLSDMLHIPMERAIVTRLDVGKNIILKYPTSVYLSHLGMLKYATRLQEPTGLYYSLKDGRLCFYDKNREQINRKEQIPEVYHGKNVLRYEQRYTKRIAGKLRVPEVRGGTLYDEAFYMALLNGWRDAYKEIKKINDITLNFEYMTSKKQLYRMGLISLIEGVGGQLEMINQINDAQKRGKLSKKQAYDMREAVNEVCKIKGGLTAQNDAITELDKKISEAVRFYR